jgi:hypothetical protein
MNVAQAIESLTHHSITPEQAVNKLSYLAGVTEALKIYRHFFPKEFAACNLNLRPITGTEDLQATVEKCLRLVNKKLFVIPDWYFDERAYEEFPLGHIPIDPMFDEWWNTFFEDLTPLWQVLLILLGEVKPDCADYPEGEMIKDAITARQLWEGHRIDWDKLAHLCRRQRRPLRHLHLALTALYFDTGNPWMDATYEAPITQYEWSVRNVRYLKKSWQEALQANDQIWSLDKWLCEEAPRIHQLLDLWSRALVVKSN